MAMLWLPFRQYYLIYNICLDTFSANIKYSLPMKFVFNTYSDRVRISPLLLRFWLALVKWSFFAEHHSSNATVFFIIKQNYVSTGNPLVSYRAWSPGTHILYYLKGLYARNTSFKKCTVCGVEPISSDRLESCNMLDKVY